MKKLIILLLIIIIAASVVSCKGPSDEDTDLFDRVCTASEGLKAAKKSGYVVMEDSTLVSGADVWEEFYKKVGEKTPATVMIATQYTLSRENVSRELYNKEKNNYPKVFFTELKYTGDEFKVRVRLSSESKMDMEGTYKYLLHLAGDNPSTARYAKYDGFVLTDDETATWEGILEGITSSTVPEGGTVGYRHFTVYMTMSGKR